MTNQFELMMLFVLSGILLVLFFITLAIDHISRKIGLNHE